MFDSLVNHKEKPNRRMRLHKQIRQKIKKKTDEVSLHCISADRWDEVPPSAAWQTAGTKAGWHSPASAMRHTWCESSMVTFVMSTASSAPALTEANPGMVFSRLKNSLKSKSLVDCSGRTSAWGTSWSADVCTPLVGSSAGQPLHSTTAQDMEENKK